MALKWDRLAITKVLISTCFAKSFPRVSPGPVRCENAHNLIF